MYGSNSQFDGNAAFSGGGFMPSQATQAADSGLSPAKSRETQALLPLTVKQISDAFQTSDDKANFLIDGVDVNNVKLVGLLFGKEERITDVSFVLDDGTGRIDCHRWVNEAIDSKEMEKWHVRKGPRALEGISRKKQLMVYSVRPVTDYDEIANHFAECIYVHCHNSRLQKLQHSATFQAPITPSKSHQQAPSNNAPLQYTTGGVDNVANQILAYLQQPRCISSERGVHRSELAQQLNVPDRKISEVIEFLEAEGLIYSTIDENHYKSIANA